MMSLSVYFQGFCRVFSYVSRFVKLYRICIVAGMGKEIQISWQSLLCEWDRQVFLLSWILLWKNVLNVCLKEGIMKQLRRKKDILIQQENIDFFNHHLQFFRYYNCSKDISQLILNKKCNVWDCSLYDCVCIILN